MKFNDEITKEQQPKEQQPKEQPTKPSQKKHKEPIFEMNKQK